MFLLRALRAFVFFVMLLSASGVCAAGVKVGFAERDITPDIGMERPGGYGKSYFKGVHDPCKSRAVVFDDGADRVALVGVDVCFIDAKTTAAIRDAVHKECGIKPGNILLGASHTHSGGPSGMVLPGQYDHADDFVRELAYEKSSMADPVYLQRLIKLTTEAIVEADAKRVESLCSFGSGQEPRASYNRRHRMKNGLTYTHPRQGNPDMLGYAGPIDPEVGVIGVWDKAGELLGCVVNFACHATTSPGMGNASADYIYYIEKTIRGYFGEDTPVIFLNGASGDITQVNNACLFQRPFGGAQAARELGGRIGAEALKVLFSAWERSDEVPVAAKAKVLSIERRKPAPERVEAAYQLIRNAGQPNYGADWVWAKETIMLDALLKSEPVAEVEVQALQVGPAVFVAVPAEYFCQYGLDIKAGSTFPFTFPVSLANGCIGYVPTEEALGPGGGGYETRLTSYSNLQVTAGTLMAKTGGELANSLTPGPVPELLRIKPANPNAAWSYGNVPPQTE